MFQVCTMESRLNNAQTMAWGGSGPQSGQELVLTNDDARLLILIGQFASHVTRGLRYNSLLVLVYEAIMEGVLQYDFCPAPVVLTLDGRDTCVWMNTSCEAEAAIKLMAAQNLIECVKVISSIGCDAALCLTITDAGRQYILALPTGDHTAIHAFLRCNSRKRYARLDSEPTFSCASPEGHFALCPEGNPMLQVSGVTSIARVPHVTSAWLPREAAAERMTLCNALRAHEATATANKTNMGKEMSTFCVLARPTVLFSEWLPVGEEELVVLATRLRSASAPPAATTVVLIPPSHEMRVQEEAETSLRLAAQGSLSPSHPASRQCNLSPSVCL